MVTILYCCLVLALFAASEENLGTCSLGLDDKPKMAASNSIVTQDWQAEVTGKCLGKGFRQVGCHHIGLAGSSLTD